MTEREQGRETERERREREKDKEREGERGIERKKDKEREHPFPSPSHPTHRLNKRANEGESRAGWGMHHSAALRITFITIAMSIIITIIVGCMLHC